MSDLPAPLVPPEVDLSGYTYTPIVRALLFGSRFHARTTDSEWRAGVTLWLKSWEQLPTGSLPDDDIELCRLAELARDMKAWAKVKEMALFKWVKCSDGRLYHPIVAKGVLEAWAAHRKASKKGKAGAAKRWGGGPEGGGGGDGPGNGTGMPVPSGNDGTGNSPGIAQALPAHDGGQCPGNGDGREEKRREEKISDSSSSSGANPRAAPGAVRCPGTEEDGLPALDLPNSIIRDFDLSRAAVFGDGAARPWPNHLDRPVAEQWIAGGADLALCRAVFDAVNRRLLARGHEPRKMLKGMDEDMRAALSERDRAPGAVRAGGAAVVQIRREVDADALAAELARLGALEEGAA